MQIEPNVPIGKLRPLTRFVGQSGKAVWECRCGCRRMLMVDESRLNGEHPTQARSCRACDDGTPNGDSPGEVGSADQSEASPVSCPSETPAANTTPAAEPIQADELPDISPLELRGRAAEGKYLVRCKCGVEFVASKRLLIGSKRIKRCAGCVR